MGSRKGVFFFKYFYSILDIRHAMPFPVTVIGIHESLQKCFFLHGKLVMVLTIDQIQKRGWVLANRRVLCK